MTIIAEATKNAIEKAALFHAAKSKENELYYVHTEAEIAEKTARNMWLNSGTESNKAEREWQEAQRILSKAILESAK